MRVSIVIPVHNEERHLHACLQAIATQTVPPYEVIIVDNNSTDKSAAIANSYSFVRLLSEPRQGIAAARSTGFDAATGDIIGRVDADIRIPPSWVAHLQRFYAEPRHRQNAWSGAGYFYNVRLPRLVNFAYRLLAFRFNKLLIGHYTLWGSNMALTREQWQTVRHEVCKRTGIHEDLDLAIHLNAHGYPPVYDRTIKTRAELRRVHSDHHKLWDYLQWWPRTLRIHGKRTWIICWFVGAFLLYLATFILVVVDKLASVFKR